MCRGYRGFGAQGRGWEGLGHEVKTSTVRFAAYILNPIHPPSTLNPLGFRA